MRRPTDSSRSEGTPSPSEVPSGGARAFCLLLRFSKVSRCKSGTHSSRYRRNGYVLGPIQHPGRPRGRHRGQVESSHRPSHIWTSECQVDTRWLFGRHRGQVESSHRPSHIWTSECQVNTRWLFGRHEGKPPHATIIIFDTNSTTVLACNFLINRARCTSTVRWEIPRRRAISLDLSPFTMCMAISRSRGVKSPVPW
ncbi:hypothetical protein [Pseudomonas sp. 28 E 9]|nr:hypothetical protein [Pseudomonas sp. 28 E 9]